MLLKSNISAISSKQIHCFRDRKWASWQETSIGFFCFFLLLLFYLIYAKLSSWWRVLWWSVKSELNFWLIFFFSSFQFQATVKEGVTGVMVNLTVNDKDDPTTGAWRAVYTIINGNPGQSFEIHTNPNTNEGMLSVVKVWRGGEDLCDGLLLVG